MKMKKSVTHFIRNHLVSKQVSKSKAVSQENRGRELPGFINYKVFETVLQTLVAKLKEPANDLLSSMKGTSHNIVLKDVLVLNNFNNFCTCGCLSS